MINVYREQFYVRVPLGCRYGAYCGYCPDHHWRVTVKCSILIVPTAVLVVAVCVACNPSPSDTRTKSIPPEKNDPSDTSTRSVAPKNNPADTNTKFAVPLDKYLLRIVPRPVVIAQGKVTGSFKLVDGTTTVVGDPPQDVVSDGIISAGSGGACLVADLSASIGGEACNTRADCNDDLEKFRALTRPDKIKDERFAYCLPPKGNDGHKKCWIRPGYFCDIRQFNPLFRDYYYLPASATKLVADANPLNDGKPVRWLVHACLNKYNPGLGHDYSGCGPDDPNESKTWDSPVVTYP